MAVFGQFVVFFLKTEEPLHKTVQQLLLRLFLDDAACNFFFMNYGGCKFQSQRALDVEGDFARIPPSGASAFFVENMNHFVVVVVVALLLLLLACLLACLLLS